MGTQEIKAACRGCHGGCMHILTVEDGRVVKVRPDPEGPLNHGHACVKGMTIIEQMYHPDRLLYPMRRKGERGNGTWERITWDQAYELIAERVGRLRREYGPECVALTTGTGRHHLAQVWRFGNVLETPNATSSGALICLGPRMNAGRFTAGVFAGVDYYGEVKPAGLLVWGANPAVSGADGELQWCIRDAVRAGTPLVVVDPQPTELARQAACWLRLRPGTDGALALSLLHVLISEGLYDRAFVEQWTVGFPELARRCAQYPPERAEEITWVKAEDIRRAARLLASWKPMSLEWGCAVEQTPNSFQTCRAIYMIPALLGSWDVPGGFVASKEIAPTVDPLFDRLSPELACKCLSGGYPLNDGTASPKMFAHPHETLEAMRTGRPYKIRALFSHANNSLISMPDARHVYDCLKELEFFVYMDFFMTPTAELADVVLPAALWPEVDSLFCMPEFGDQALLVMRKAVQVGECKSDEDFFLELSRRMGLDYGADSQEELLDGLRGAKDAEELRRMERAQQITDEAFEAICGWIRPGMTEREIAARLVYELLRRGGERVSFDPIVASGPNSSMPHAVPTDRKVREGDFITMDFGCVAEGYCSDMTRTVALGQPTAEMEQVYQVVLEAQLAGIAAARAGIPGREIDAAARRVIAEAGYGDCFTHSFGHSLGLSVHEGPNAAPGEGRIMPAGCVVSAEPGIYLPGRFGVRIEDVLVLEEGGCRVLTRSPKELRRL